MPSTRPRTRLALLVVLLALIGVLVVVHGTIPAHPQSGSYPDEDDLVADYDTYVGQHAEFSGTVVATDPVQVRLSDGVDTRTVTVESFDNTVVPGESVTVFGTVKADNVVTVTDKIVRQPWENRYMYLVSLLGGLWILARMVNGWRFNRRNWAIEPRNTPRVSREESDDA